MPDTPRFDRRRLILDGIAIAGLAACSGPPDRRAEPVPPTTTTGVAGAAVGATTARTMTTVPATAPPAPTGSVPNAADGASATFIDHGARDRPLVALTYHASGDPGLAAALLDTLDSHAVKVTVFAVGAWISRHIDLGHRIVSAGHELGNHTMNHKAMGSLGSAELSAEIDGGARALIPFIGSIGRWFRPSGIAIPTPAILAAAGAAGYDDSIGYDVDSLDYQDPGPSAVLANVARELRPGSIVSMHFGHRGTIEATPPIIELLASRGLGAVTLSDLLA